MSARSWATSCTAPPRVCASIAAQSPPTNRWTMRPTLSLSTGFAALALALLVSVSPVRAQDADAIGPAAAELDSAPAATAVPTPVVGHDVTESQPAPAASAEPVALTAKQEPAIAAPVEAVASEP